jgi:type II secretory pathway pseudopilin PulG
MTTAIVVIVILVLLALAAVALMARARRTRRREGLQERFGPEYDRAIEAHGDRKAAEKRLADTADRRDKIDVRALEPAERERYAREWTDVQGAFVDQPGPATRDADRLVQAVMRDRGYPVDDFATRAEMLATDHPQVVEHYRAAHAVGSRTEGADTESLRQAFVHYRALFELLLEDGHGTRPTGDEPVDLRDQQPHRTT